MSAPLPMVPDMVQVLADRSLLDGLSFDALVNLRRHVGFLRADLDAAITCQMMRAFQRPPSADLDRLLSPAQAASVFGVNRRWLLEHADEIPGVRRLSRKTIRFSERALRRHLNCTKYERM
jgi:hypothetical protein